MQNENFHDLKILGAGIAIQLEFWFIDIKIISKNFIILDFDSKLLITLTNLDDKFILV